MHADPYQRAKRNHRIFVFGLATFLFLTVGLPVLYFGRQLVRIRRDVAHFYDQTAESRLLGKTPEQVVALLGPPRPDLDNSKPTTSPWETVVWVYYGPFGEICRIEFAGGAAVKVEHYGR